MIRKLSPIKRTTYFEDTFNYLSNTTPYHNIQPSYDKLDSIHINSKESINEYYQESPLDQIHKIFFKNENKDIDQLSEKTMVVLKKYKPKYLMYHKELDDTKFKLHLTCPNP